MIHKSLVIHSTRLCGEQVEQVSRRIQGVWLSRVTRLLHIKFISGWLLSWWTVESEFFNDFRKDSLKMIHLICSNLI